MITTVSLVMICHYTKILPRYYYILHTVHFILVIHPLCNWEVVPLNLPYIFFSSPNLPPLRRPTICSLYQKLCFYFMFFHLFCFQIAGISEIRQYLSFSVWLISLDIILPKIVHIAANGSTSFFFIAEWYSIVNIYLLIGT